MNWRPVEAVTLVRPTRAVFEGQVELVLDYADLRDERGPEVLCQIDSQHAFWGMLIGLLFLNPLLGLAVGAGAGALSGKLTALGVDNSMAKQLGDELTPGSSALIVLLRNVTADKVLDGLKQFAGRGRVFQTSLSKDDEKSLREVLETPEATKVA